MLVIERRSWSRSGEFKRLLVLALAALLVMALAFQTAGAAVEPQKTDRAYIVSLWYGVFRAAEYQGGPPFVELGSHVEPGTIVGIIEPLMVDQTEGVIAVPAGYKGTITRAIVRDGEIVTIGQRLFEVLLDPPTARDTPTHDSSAR
ncbi:MAG: hypothetical protein OES79_03880 [Planctomycetota bacterium]|nr:hypothetical protein [Planctomycetota bacterium]